MTHRSTHSISSNTRWLANVTYKSDNGPYAVAYSFNVPEQLTDLIEAAQEWQKVIEIEILLVEDDS